jgi:large subunit ribosomal protein L4
VSIATAPAETVDRTVDVRTPDGSTDGTVTLPGALFDAQANIALMHQVVVAQLAAARQGTHSTKTRGEVAGGGTKPYRQKGTGRARQGSIRAPQFAGGGTVHGPTPHGYAQKTPKKMKVAALRGALSDRARDGRIHVLSALLADGVPSTKAAVETLGHISEAKRLLIVAERTDEAGWKSLRNVDAVHLLDPGQLNTYDVLVSDEVVFTKAALESFVARSATAPVDDAVVAAPADDAVAEASADAVAESTETEEGDK